MRVWSLGWRRPEGSKPFICAIGVMDSTRDYGSLSRSSNLLWHTKGAVSRSRDR